MNTIADGRAIAQKIKDTLSDTSTDGVQLDVIVVGDNQVTATFVAAKKRFAEQVGISFVQHTVSESSSTEEVVNLIRSLKGKTNGIVVQLPLPDTFDTDSVLAAIDPSVDVDVINPATFIKFKEGTTPFIPPVAGAVQEIFNTYNVDVQDKNVVIIGKGRLVGEPVRVQIEKRGAIVTVLDSKTTPQDFAEALKNADIVVSGAGVPNLVRSEMLQSGVVLIDAGTSSAGRTVSGDIHEDCLEVASLFSKTPGGVGPITVAVLFRNLLAVGHN